MRSRVGFSFGIWLLTAALPACGSKGSVSLFAEIEQPTVEVVDGAAGTSLSGSFQLSLALGPEASGATRVTLGNFSLQTEAGAPLIDVLNVTSKPEFPIDVAKGATEVVNFTFEADSVDRTALCAGKVRIIGSVMDSLKGGTDPVSSVLIAPACGAT